MIQIVFVSVIHSLAQQQRENEYGVVLSENILLLRIYRRMVLVVFVIFDDSGKFILTNLIKPGGLRDNRKSRRGQVGHQ